MSAPNSTGMSDAADPSEASARGGQHRRLARSTLIFSVATGLSRVLGLVREMVAAYYFGINGKINAFTVAFQIPNLVRALLADAALSGAFVPVFSDLIEKGDRKRAWRVASTVFWLVLLVLGGLTAIFILIAPLLIKPFGDPGGDFDLAVGLSRVLFPIVVLLGLSGVIVGILNTYDHFTVPALTPVFWNLAIIAGLWLGVPRVDGEDAALYVYAGAILVATLIQLFLPVPWLRGLDGRIQLVLDWRDPAVRRIFTLMLPVTLTLGLINVSAVIDTLIASRLVDPDLAPAAINSAFRLYMLPQGMFSVAVATVLFPALARLAARNDLDGFRATISTGLRQIGFLLIPAAIISTVLATPIVRLVYERGAFTESDVTVVAGCLAAFSLGLVFNGWMLMMTRGFYGLQSNWLPTMIGVGTLVLNALLDLVLYRVGVWGIPLATSIVNIVGAGLLVFFLRRRVGGARPRARHRRDRAHHARLARARRDRLRGLVRARRCPRPLDRRADRLARRGARDRCRWPTSARAGCSACASSTRSGRRCRAARSERALTTERKALGSAPMNVSPGSVEDVPRVAALYRACFDDRVITVAGIRHRQIERSAGGRAAVLARRGGWRARSAGRSAAAMRSPLRARRRTRASSSTRPTAAPESARRSGTLVSGHLDAIGARRIVAYSRADADTVAFVRARGFSLESTDTTSAVDPRTLPRAAGTAGRDRDRADGGVRGRPDAGVRGRQGKRSRRAGPVRLLGHHVRDLASPDLGRAGLRPRPERRRRPPTASSSERRSSTSDRETGRAMNAGTGVIRAFRGRGLGFLMKQHSLARAAAAGITKVITQNDDTNAPMLAINAKLGYAPLSSGHAWVLER